MFHVAVNLTSDSFISLGFALALVALSLASIVGNRNKEQDSVIIIAIGAISTFLGYMFGMPILAGVGVSLVVTGITMKIEVEIDKKPENKNS